MFFSVEHVEVLSLDSLPVCMPCSTINILFHVVCFGRKKTGSIIGHVGFPEVPTKIIPDLPVEMDLRLF